MQSMPVPNLRTGMLWVRDWTAIGLSYADALSSLVLRSAVTGRLTYTDIEIDKQNADIE